MIYAMGRERKQLRHRSFVHENAQQSQRKNKQNMHTFRAERSEHKKITFAFLDVEECIVDRIKCVVI